MKNRFLMFSVVFLSLTLLHTTCWANSAWVTIAAEDADNVFSSEITYDGQTTAKWEYRVANLKTAGDTEAVPFLLPSDQISIGDMEAFLSQRNITAKELADYIDKYKVSLREFIDHADSFGTNTVLFIELLDGINKAAAEQGLGDFFGFLRDTDTSMAEFVDTMGQVYGEKSAYLDRMYQYELNFDEWYAGYLSSDAESFSEWLGTSASLSSGYGTRSPIAVIAGIFSIIGVVYDIIKSSNVVTVSDASTRILHKDDTNPMDYGNAKSNKTGKWKWLVKNFAGVTCFEVELHAESLYDGRHNTISGHFLPRIKVVVDKVNATFPWSVDAKVTIDKNLANIGTVEFPDPQGQMDIRVDCHWQVLFIKGFDNRHLTASFSGKNGIKADW
ncbi:hypothetical protein AAU61_05740 [Desulfocarbo indianensis]|nr:hypothetical protein AAU61_05740 [Desulfocarbo indianensis]